VRNQFMMPCVGYFREDEKNRPDKSNNGVDFSYLCWVFRKSLSVIDYSPVHNTDLDKKVWPSRKRHLVKKKWRKKDSRKEKTKNNAKKSAKQAPKKAARLKI